MNADPHVFREVDGRLQFVGDFEGLYQTCPDPWGQAGDSGRIGSYYTNSRKRLISTIRHHTRFKKSFSGLEVGCGLGQVTILLTETLSNCAWDGMDVSPTAISKARELYPSRTLVPRYNFFVGDILNLHTLRGDYDVVLLNQVLWYVLHDFDNAIWNAACLLRPGGLLVVSQAFLSDQRYGKNIIDGFRGLTSWFCREYVALWGKLQLLEANYDDDNKYDYHDGIVVLRRV